MNCQGVHEGNEGNAVGSPGVRSQHVSIGRFRLGKFHAAPANHRLTLKKKPRKEKAPPKRDTCSVCQDRSNPGRSVQNESVRGKGSVRAPFGTRSPVFWPLRRLTT
jgi:hypothetical protein